MFWTIWRTESARLVTWSAMVHEAAQAAEMAADAGIGVELIDLRTLYPWDRKAVLGSVEKTGRLLAEALELSEDEYLVSFQSLFGKEVWLQPYTDETLKKWAADGVESVDVICPGFSADCLETIEEIDGENRGYFEGGGGKRYRYIPALNDRDDHVACLADVVLRHLQGWEGAAAQTGERGATYPHPT